MPVKKSSSLFGATRSESSQCDDTSHNPHMGKCCRSRSGGMKILWVLVGIFVALAGLREMAPIVAGSMVGAKSGSEITSVLANMRISRQIDALEIMAIDPIWYLVTPKLIAIIFVLPLLSIISGFCVCASGYLVSIYQLDISRSTFITHASRFIFFRDFSIGAFKGFSFGIIICIICTFFGYTSKPGPEGVGNATNKAVVFSCISCIIANYFLTEIFY